MALTEDERLDRGVYECGRRPGSATRSGLEGGRLYGLF